MGCIGVRRTTVVFSFCATLAAAPVHARKSSGASSCNDWLGGSEVGGKTNAENAISVETHTLLDFVTADPARNLVLQHPLSVLNAYQRQRAIFEREGEVIVEDVAHPGRQFRVPRLFTDGVAAVDNMRVIGQDKGLHELAAAIRAMSEGDRTGRTLVLMLGPPGTAKSEAGKIAVKATSAYSESDPELFTYTYEWIGEKLAAIPTLRARVPVVVGADGTRTYRGLKPFLSLSPMALLPEAYQQQLTEKIRPLVLERLGVQAAPIVEADAQSKEIREEILKFHSNRDFGGRALTNAEIVQILNEYLVVRRFIPARFNPVIEDQGTDVHWEGLFASENIRNSVTEGPQSPFSYYPGQLPNANGSLVVFEEVLNNRTEFLKKLQRAIEDLKVSHGGSGDIPLNMVMLAMSNDDSIQGKEAELRAFFDRVIFIRMDWPLRPHTILETLLYMKADKGLLRAQPLLTAEEALDPSHKENEAIPMVGRAAWNAVFPAAEFNKVVHGPDRRFALTYGFGAGTVTISPHAVMHIAHVVAASRLRYDEKEAAKHGKFDITSNDIFNHPSQRLKAYMGLIELTPAQAEELEELRVTLGEGRTGLSARDAGRWFLRALDLARLPKNGNTLTPQIVREAFYDLLVEKAIRWPNVQIKTRWAVIESAIAKEFMANSILDDIARAISQDATWAETMAKEVLEELYALGENPLTSVYQAEGQTGPRTIDRTRLEALGEIYKELYNTEFPTHALAEYVRMARAAGKDPKSHRSRAIIKPSPQLIATVNAYILKSIRENLPGDLGIARVRFPTLIPLLKRHLGYNDMGIEASLGFLRYIRAYAATTGAR